jgi:hypothetical protein
MTADGGLDRNRLARLLGMFGSNFDGEVVNAARAAHALVTGAGLVWPDVVLPMPQPAPAPDRDEPVFETIHDVLDFCLRHRHALTPWEDNFCQSVSRRQKPLTVKQVGVLHRILDKLLVTEAATS